MQMTEIARLASANAVAALLPGGYLDLFDGAWPVDPDDATAGTLLIRRSLASPGATVSDDGTDSILTLNFLTIEGTVTTTGTATHFRILQADGTTPVIQGGIGDLTGDLVLPTTMMTEGYSFLMSTAQLRILQGVLVF